MLNKKILVITAAFTGLSLCVIATRPPANGYVHLQVLPKDISSRDLNRIMVDEFTDGLGVSCNFCHAEDKKTHKPDYASDEKPEKSIARAMMRMTIGLNKKYFKLKHPLIGAPTMVVNCSTCHNGQPHPGNPATE
ncbi:MAG TPA: c-type cytochrome [Puia sp.]|nr:c-type cytochrome [Puia sp.]